MCDGGVTTALSWNTLTGFFSSNTLAHSYEDIFTALDCSMSCR
jgi:hypothetical protein